MTVFEAIRAEVPAEAAARLYGLRFDRSGRAFCPWHDDGKHAALAFYGERCFCHACHSGGDATALTAQLLGLSMKDAAERLRQDFHLDAPVKARPDPVAKAKAKALQDEREACGRRWNFLCEVVREADAKLATFTPDKITPEFDRILAARVRANHELDELWEVMKFERRRSR